jgi:hypothetical protein
LSRFKTTYGDEGAERLLVDVSPDASDSTPTGTVTIGESSSTLCSISLRDAKGSCNLAARKISAGSYDLVANYGGSAGFSSSSARAHLVVAKEGSKIVLRLSAAKAIVGDENAEGLSVTVSPEFAGSTPTGRVTIGTSTKTLCTISLSLGKGSCSFPARRLAPGAYPIVASYAGSRNFGASLSTRVNLTIFG